MQYRTLGATGCRVSAIGLGAWGIGGQWGRVEHDVALATVRAAYDAGVTFFDTADAYGDPPGLSEELLAEALRPVRREVMIATKVGNFARRAGHPLSYASPLHVELCCDASLRRLRTDVIDVYQCHIGERLEIFLEAFERLRRKGKIRFGGISTNSLETLRAFDRDGDCAVVQLDYSLVNRAAEWNVLRYAQERRMGVIVRGPLAQGVCAGKFGPETRFTDSVRAGWMEGAQRDRFHAQLRTMDRLRFLETPARPLAAAALQFVLAHPAVSVAIPGAKTPEQARANAAAADGALSVEELVEVSILTRA